jgi:hypothetical protein
VTTETTTPEFPAPIDYPQRVALIDAPMMSHTPAACIAARVEASITRLRNTQRTFGTTHSTIADVAYEFARCRAFLDVLFHDMCVISSDEHWRLRILLENESNDAKERIRSRRLR